MFCSLFRRISTHLRLLGVESLSDGHEQLAEALETLGLGVAKQLHDALVVHDLLGEHAQLEELADEADVAQSGASSLDDRVLQVLRLLFLLLLQIKARVFP